MITSTGFASTLRTLIIVLVLLCYGVQPLQASGSFHSHHRNLHYDLHKRNGTAANSSMTLEEARDIVREFQKAMAPANTAILNTPQPNVYRLLNESELAQVRQKAPYLEYGASNSSFLTSTRRRFRRGATNATTIATNSSVRSYSIPPEVVEASRIMAEATPPDTTSTDYATLIRELKARYQPDQNDTNVMPQKMKHPSGLAQYVPLNQLPLTIQNGTVVAGPVLETRASTSYWQETITQLGESPFAPAGYKVWRNVKDYGAKGDGVTDDTAAIQKAISDGGRCGAGCPSSSIYPATVYFPAGTYLVSSSITQYYNTELLGNPIDIPTIVASSSFVGLGVIGSDVYTGAKTEWYLNTNNFLRSIRNFIIDIRAAPQDAQVCGLHWQVAQASSLENIMFFSTDPNDVPSTTQQGIYMENGSGGFLGDLYFVGGLYGAFLGNQQFTASGLYFTNCKYGLQISWDWGWTMQGLVFENCEAGVVIVGGAGGPMSTGQGVGSLVLTDMVMIKVVIGVETTLLADNSTAFLVQNSVFTNVNYIVFDTNAPAIIYPGAASGTVRVDAWGFGRVINATGQTSFLNGAELAAPTRPLSLVQSAAEANQGFYFTRRRPSYATLGNSQLIDVKAWGAKGDGSSDDTAVLNYILSAAANMSAIVYVPFGVYLVTDTLYVPVGSRIIGQAWPQIMATGSKFSNISNPHVAVQVGDPGSVGAVELQCMMFTVRGPTAGAVLMEWNVLQSTQGSAGLWDSHFRVGGAQGSNLQAADCPTTSDKSSCMAASLMLHITSSASAYLENVWMWTADHDMDAPNQDQINVFAARGLLVESPGPTWLWGTAVEHAVLYQYQLSGASNVVMGLIQTESPYFQAAPAAPDPFAKGLVYANDPTFSDCAGGSQTCAMSWAVRLVDSSTVYILSTGLYTWFQDYDQTCINSGANDCQQRVFYVEESSDIWVFNLVTIGNIEMISPLNSPAVLAESNRNGYASSILAWLEGTNGTSGGRNFTGYQLYSLDNLTNTNFPDTCKTALTATITCDNYTLNWLTASYHGALDNETLQTQVCDAGCGQSLESYYNSVNTNCAGYTWSSGAPPAMFGGYIYYGYNETCQKDPASGAFCNDVISNFTLSDSLDSMPTSELCSDCYLGRLKMMQQSTYSIFNTFTWFQTALQQAVTRCSLVNQPTSTQPALIQTPSPSPVCVSGKYYTVQAGDTTNSIALANSVSSAAIFTGNSGLTPPLLNSTDLPVGADLCLPLTCQTYLLRSDDDCLSASINAGVTDITQYNPWINVGCDNLQSANATLGSVLCASPLGGTYVPGTATNTSSFPGSEETGYGTSLVAPPAGAVVAPGTTLSCGGWYTVQVGDSCASVTIGTAISLDLFGMVNPSVNTSSCTASLVAGDAYCIAPLHLSDNVTIDYSAVKSLGCWTNANPSNSSFVLSEGNYTDSANMTVSMCAQTCIGQDIALFGLLGSDNCFCGETIGMDSAQAAASQCSMACAGNSSETCGGANAMSLFGPSDLDFLPFEYTEVGCYADSADVRALSSASALGSTNNTIDACADFCLPTYAYFGVENGVDCWCGNVLNPSAGLLNDTSCSTACPGFGEETCGGSGSIDIYTFNSSLVPSD